MIDLEKYRLPTQPSSGGLDLDKYKLTPPAPPPAPQPRSLFDKVTGAAKTATDFLGFGNTTKTLGNIIAKAAVPQAQKQYVPTPTNKDLAGAALNVGSLLVPVGAIEKTAAGVAAHALPGTAARLAGKIAAGVTIGGAYDAGQALEAGKTPMPGAATALGVGLPLAGEGAHLAGALASKFSAAQAPGIINSLIKPLLKDLSYGKDPGRAIAELGIKANSFDDLIEKVSQARQATGKAIGEIGNTLEGKSVLRLQDALKPIDEAMQTAASQNNSTLLDRLQKVKVAITHNLGLGMRDGGPTIVQGASRNLASATFKEAREILAHIGDMTQFTGNPSDDKLVNSALKKTYGAIKDETLKAADAVDPAIGKQFRKLTEQYADLTSAKIAATYRDKIVQRHNLIGLTPTVAGVGSALLTAIATGGAAIPALLAGGAGVAIDKALSSTAFKTRVAAALAKHSPQEIEALTKAIPALKTFTSPGDMLLKAGQRYFEKNPPGIGMSIKPVLPKLADIHPDDLHAMERFIDYARLGKNLSDAGFAEAEKLTERFGISMDLGLKRVANEFEKVLNGSRNAPNTVAPNRDTLGRFAKPVLPKTRQ
jgi:hypothetical protein